METKPRLYNRLWFQIAALSIIFIILHIPTLQLDYLRDDIFILNKCETTSWKSILVDGFRFSRIDFGNVWWVEVKDIAHFFRPLLIASYKLTILIFGNHPFIHHLINVLIHLLTAILLLFTGRRIFKSSVAPFLGAAFFLFSMHNQWTVMWIVARKELLVGLFMLAAFNFHISGKRLLAASSMILAMMCGEHAVAFPFIVIAFGLLTNGEGLDTKTPPSWKNFGKTIGAQWRQWVMYLSILGLYIVVRHLMLGGLPLPPSPYFTHPLSEGAWSFYALKKILFATALTISMLFVDRPIMTLWINHPSIMILCVVLTIGVLWWAYRVSKSKLLFITFALLSLVSFLPFTPMVAMPIYLYTPMIFCSLTVGIALDGPCAKKREDRSRPERYFLVAVIVTIILHIIGTGIWTYSRFNEKFSYPIRTAPRVAALIGIAENSHITENNSNPGDNNLKIKAGKTEDVRLLEDSNAPPKKRPIVLVDLPPHALTLPFLLQEATGRTGGEITAVSMHMNKRDNDGSTIRRVRDTSPGSKGQRSWIIENKGIPYFRNPSMRALSFLPKGLIKEGLTVDRAWFTVSINELGPTPPEGAWGHRFFTTEPSVISIKFTTKEDVPEPIIIVFRNEEPELWEGSGIEE